MINITKKNFILLIIFGMLLSGIPVMALCSSYCVAGEFDLDSAMDGSCPFSLHSFIQIAIVLSALFILTCAGFLQDWDRLFIPPGAYWPLFRPPRFSRR